jgi:hypothetical protein
MIKALLLLAVCAPWNCSNENWRALRAKAAAAAVMASLDTSTVAEMEVTPAQHHGPETGILFIPLAEAVKSGRPLFIYMHGKRCGPCRLIERDVLTDARVIRATVGFACVSLDEDEMLDTGGGKGVKASTAFRVGFVPRCVFCTADYVKAGDTGCDRDPAAFADNLNTWLERLTL